MFPKEFIEKVAKREEIHALVYTLEGQTHIIDDVAIQIETIREELAVGVGPVRETHEATRARYLEDTTWMKARITQLTGTVEEQDKMIENLVAEIQVMKGQSI